jgi:flavorubredoxin
MEWADNYQENQITIIYDTMWNGTRRMAEVIAQGIKSVDDAVVVKLYNASKYDKNDIITEVFKSKAVLVGSPTINRGVSFAIAGILEMIKGLGFKKKKAAAFGAYGWSGESVKIIIDELNKAGFAVVDDGIKALWNPDEQGLEQCKEFGQKFAKSL